MKLILIDIDRPNRINFHPLALSRPIWELRCGLSTLGEKFAAKFGQPAGCFVPTYMAASYKAKTSWKVNDASVLSGDDLLLVGGRIKAESLQAGAGQSEIAATDNGEVLYARIAKADLAKAPAGGIDALLAWAIKTLPAAQSKPETWNYIWELVLANGKYITEEFRAQGRSGIEGTVEQPNAIRGNAKDVFVGQGALIHPMVVIDAANGPVIIEEGAEIHPFTRIEGPCHIGKKSILLGAKCREGNTIGPMCRVGGEVEESIIQGYSNKYHDGFLGHAYVGEWVNLGAMTANSDLKNDYSNVAVVMDGRNKVDTGSTKVGAIIGDHTKTSIGTLFNTGAYVGAMALVVASGRLMPKYLPSFGWYLNGAVSEGKGKANLYQTARIAMSRRKCAWTADEEAMWDAIYELTAPARAEAINKGRKA